MRAFFYELAASILVEYGMLTIPLFAFMMGCVLAWRAGKQRGSWPDGVALGLVSMAAVTVFLNVVAEKFPYREEDPQAFTPAEAAAIEDEVRGWLDQPQWQVSRRIPEPEQYFSFDVELVMVAVNVSLEKPSNLLFLRTLMVADEDFLARDESSRGAALDAIALELLRMLMQFDALPDRVLIIDTVVYTEALTQYEFTRHLITVVNAAKVAAYYFAREPV